jgi:hypothetical protein
MIVFVVLAEYDYGGEDRVRVFATRQEAEAYAISWDRETDAGAIVLEREI